MAKIVSITAARSRSGSCGPPQATVCGFLFGTLKYDFDVQVAFLIDGFNLYHSLRDASRSQNLAGRGTRWLDLDGFCRAHLQLIGPTAQLAGIQYFTALATHTQKHLPQGVSRHQQYIRCVEDTGIQVVLGRFKQAGTRVCSICGHNSTRYEEKETDVAVASHLIEHFVNGDCDCAMIVTGDTDIAAGVKVAKRLFPAKKIGFVFPFKRQNDELKNLADYSYKVKSKLYLNHQLPNPFTLKNGTQIVKPGHW
ncbi:MAG: NYN domain-containing protein [Trueperaceae bacterium]